MNCGLKCSRAVYIGCGVRVSPARQMCAARGERSSNAAHNGTQFRLIWPPLGNLPALFTDVYYVDATTNIIMLIKKQMVNFSVWFMEIVQHFF